MPRNCKTEEGGIVKITASGQRPVFKPITGQQLRQIGGKAIGLRVAAVTQNHTGSNGAAMAPYSKRGPIYIPLTGKGRTKTSLGGRQVLTQADLRAARKLGRGASQTPSKKSVKFADWAAYKRFLGKSGNPDLQLSGAMLNAMTIVRQDQKSVTYGFTREQERQKAQGNERRRPWFALAPVEQKNLGDEITRVYGAPVAFK